MRNLRIAWSSLLLVGWLLLFTDLLYETVRDIQGVPVLSTIGAALFLLALTSMLSWLAKVAWEERSRRDSSNRERD